MGLQSDPIDVTERAFDYTLPLLQSQKVNKTKKRLGVEGKPF